MFLKAIVGLNRSIKNGMISKCLTTSAQIHLDHQIRQYQQRMDRCSKAIIMRIMNHKIDTVWPISQTGQRRKWPSAAGQSTPRWRRDLRAVSDHDVGMTLGHVIEDCAVVGKFFALCVRKMRFGEGLIGNGSRSLTIRSGHVRQSRLRDQSTSTTSVKVFLR